MLIPVVRRDGTESTMMTTGVLLDLAHLAFLRIMLTFFADGTSRNQNGEMTEFTNGGIRSSYTKEKPPKVSSS